MTAMLGSPTILFVPGLRDHVEDHWQTHASRAIPGSRTVEPLDADRLSRAARVAALDRALRDIEGEVVLVGHSAGCLSLKHRIDAHIHQAMGIARALAGLGKVHVHDTAKSDVAAAAVALDPADPALGAAGLNNEVKTAAVAIATGTASVSHRGDRKSVHAHFLSKSLPTIANCQVWTAADAQEHESPCKPQKFLAFLRAALDVSERKIGGDGGIRTLGAAFTARRFSKPLVSATHPRLRMACRANDSWPRRVAIAMHFAPRNA